MRNMSAAALLVVGAVVGAVAASAMSTQTMMELEEHVASWLARRASPSLTSSLVWIMRMHSNLALCSFSALLAAALARQGRWRAAAAIALVVPGGLLLNRLLALSWYSFPSSQTAGAVLFYGMLGALLWQSLRPVAKAGYVAAALLLVAAVSFAQLYLGLRYLTEELASASAGTAWLVLCLTMSHARAFARPP
jgi:membrane-associated phospholipid phosphatase